MTDSETRPADDVPQADVTAAAIASTLTAAVTLRAGDDGEKAIEVASELLAEAIDRLARHIEANSSLEIKGVPARIGGQTAVAVGFLTARRSA